MCLFERDTKRTRRPFWAVPYFKTHPNWLWAKTNQMFLSKQQQLSRHSSFWLCYIFKQQQLIVLQGVHPSGLLFSLNHEETSNIQLAWCFSAPSTSFCRGRITKLSFKPQKDGQDPGGQFQIDLLESKRTEKSAR